MLLQSGYKALTIRNVASACGIAPGTLYNYFPSKDMLCAAIMLEDWQKLLDEGKRNTTGTADCITGLKSIFDSIRAFTDIYRNAWSEASGSSYITSEYHSRLVESIRSLVRPLLETSGSPAEPDPSTFLSEVLIISATRSDVGFENIKPFIIKLI